VSALLRRDGGVNPGEWSRGSCRTRPCLSNSLARSGPGRHRVAIGVVDPGEHVDGAQRQVVGRQQIQAPGETPCPLPNQPDMVSWPAQIPKVPEEARGRSFPKTKITRLGCSTQKLAKTVERAAHAAGPAAARVSSVCENRAGTRVSVKNSASGRPDHHQPRPCCGIRGPRSCTESTASPDDRGGTGRHDWPTGLLSRLWTIASSLVMPSRMRNDRAW